MPRIEFCPPCCEFYKSGICTLACGNSKSCPYAPELYDFGEMLLLPGMEKGKIKVTPLKSRKGASDHGAER